MAEGVKRKISAILSADVAGYSRLMEADEEATVRTMESYRKTVISLIEQHDGKVIDSPGDNILSEFGSVVDAIQCAVEIQHIIKAKNAGLPEARRMEFRIGINLGDLIEEEDRTYGEGVNIASRIESIADSGGICISESAYQQIKRKLSFGYEDLGEHTLKNISEPVRVYRIPMDSKAVSGPGIRASDVKRLQWVALALLAAIIISVGSITVWNQYMKSQTAPDAVKLETTTASAKKAESSLSEKPSIAVLPFDNLSGDPEQEYFADGMTEEIINRLSAGGWFTVIARNSTFSYKGRRVKTQQVGQELGARYIVEGSVRKADSKVRITAQLTDATSDSHLWSQTYDRDFGDIFAIQDEIAQHIVSTFGLKYTEAERDRIGAIPTDNLTAYELVLKGNYHRHQYNHEGDVKAKEMYEKAIQLDPEYAWAYFALAGSFIDESQRGNVESLERSYDLAKKGISLDSSLASGHTTMASVYRFKREYDLALAEIEKAVSLNPNDQWAYYAACGIYQEIGRSRMALEAMKTTMRLDPSSLYGSLRYPVELAWCYNGLGEHERAIKQLNVTLAQNPDYPFTYGHLGESYRGLGKFEEAFSCLREGIARKPDYAWLKLQLARTFRDSGQYRDAISNAEKIIGRDVDPEVYAELAWSYLKLWQTQQDNDPDILEKAIELAQKSVSLDANVIWGHLPLSASFRAKKQYDEAIAESERVIAIAPDMAHGYAHLSDTLAYMGRARKATEMAEEAVKLKPSIAWPLGHVYRLNGQLDDAVAIQRKRLSSEFGFWELYDLHTELAVLYSELGRKEEAQSEAAEVLKLVPHFSVDVWGERNPMKDREQVERDMAALRKAGLPG